MNFVELMKAKNMSMTDVSRRFGVPYRTVQNWSGKPETAPKYVIDMMQEILTDNAAAPYEDVGCFNPPEGADFTTYALEMFRTIAPAPELPEAEEIDADYVTELIDEAGLPQVYVAEELADRMREYTEVCKPWKRLADALLRSVTERK